MLRSKLFFILVILSFVVPVHSVHAADNDSYGAQMVGAGMEIFSNKISQSMLDMGGSNGTLKETPSLIFSMITYTVDPYKFSWVKHWWNQMLIFYVFVFTIACLGGAALVLLHRMSPDSISRLAWVLGEQASMTDIRGWLGRMVMGLMFPLLTLFGVYLVLMINGAVSGLITANALNAVPPTLDNMIAYFFMALAYLILSVVFALRNIIIVLFAAGSLGIAALYLIPQLQHLVKSILVYFIIIVFMQPALIFTAAIGTIFITNLPPELTMFVSVSYVALIVLLVVIGVVCIAGRGLVSKIVGVGMWRI